MIIRKASYRANAYTKKELLNHPTNVECEIKIIIGHFGTADLMLREKDGDVWFAGITLNYADEIKKLGEALLAIAAAQVAVEE